jgi:hypothetical protein
MTSDTAIRRLSFAEARHSGSEALVAMAKHRAEHHRAVTEAKASGQADAETRQADDEADRARDAARRVDKTA